MNTSLSSDPTRRFRTGAMVAISILLAVLNAFFSLIMVVMAVPGSGTIGPGFKIIGTTFLLGNVALFGCALFSSLNQRRRIQVIGLVMQFLTLPLCFGVALFVMYILGISDL